MYHCLPLSTFISVSYSGTRISLNGAKGIYDGDKVIRWGATTWVKEGRQIIITIAINKYDCHTKFH